MMMAIDPGTGLTLLGAAAGSAKVLEKLLGPTADYLGGNLKSWTERRAANLNGIFQAAVRRLGPRLDTPGVVPPRVLKEVLDTGSFAEDPVTREYFGGILAASRGDDTADDQAASVLNLLGRLSTFQIRTHYGLYCVIKRLFDGQHIKIGLAAGERQTHTFVSDGDMRVIVGVKVPEDYVAVLGHALFGLARERLIGRAFHRGSQENLASKYEGVPASGVVYRASWTGAELFLWAHGIKSMKAPAFFDSSLQFQPLLPDLGHIEGLAVHRLDNQQSTTQESQVEGHEPDEPLGV